MSQQNLKNGAPARLSDRILSALELAIEQEDVVIAEHLVRVLEMSMTRRAGSADFTEKRSYSPAIMDALGKLATLNARKL